jgi:hypothetical protein
MVSVTLMLSGMAAAQLTISPMIVTQAPFAFAVAN